ncbi:MAG TPA: hypothetical protein VLK85_15360 [Ramlibacter sp.]|nr:hypothetical protein [Ramlibacter sp.]
MAPDGRLLGSLAVSALSDRIVSREQRLVEALRQEAAACAQLWLSAGGG